MQPTTTTTIRVSGVIYTSYDSPWLSTDDGDFCISGAIARQIRDAEGDLLIEVNTPGGDIHGLAEISSALTDWSVSHPDRKAEIRVGALAASSGAALLVYAPRVNTRITAHKESRIMFHGATVSLEYAAADNCRDLAESLESFNTTLKGALLARTKIPPQLINTWFEASREGWMTADTALSYGIIDDIITSDQAAPIPRISNITLNKLKGLVAMPTPKRFKNEATPESTPGIAPEQEPAENSDTTPEQEPKKGSQPGATPEQEPAENSDTTPEQEPKKGSQPGATPEQEPAENSDATPEQEPNKDDPVAALRKQVSDLLRRVDELTRHLDHAHAINRKLTPGLTAPRKAEKPLDFASAIDAIRKEHPRMSYDDAFCAAKAKHEDLYNKLFTR